MDVQKVTIVIPCYNYGKYLAEAIESAMKQTIPCEIIVVNDGSTDETSEVAKRFPVKLIEKPNQGLAHTRNVGIEAAKGEWICCLDADDIITQDYIEKTIGKADIIGTAQKDFGNSTTLWQPPFENPVYENFRQNNCIHCAAVFRKKVWENIGGYDEHMPCMGYEDWDFWLRATKAGFTVTVVNEPLFLYRKHGHSMIDDVVKRHSEIYKYMMNK